MAQNEETNGQNKNLTNSGEDQNVNEVPMFKRKQVLIPLIIIILAAAGALYWYIGQLGYVSTDDAFVDGNKLAISSKMLGRITDLTVDEGDTVKQGQLLVQIDSTDLKAREQQAKAALSLAKESISLAKVNVARTQDDYARAKKQYKENIIPKVQYDHVQKAYEAAKAELNIDHVKIGTARAQLNVIKTQLTNTKIFTPMDGVVAKRWVLTGDIVSPGQPIFTIYDLKNIWVTADLEETKLGKVHLGDTVSISVDTYPNQEFRGQIFQIGSNTASQFSLIPPANAAGNFTKITQRVPIKISIKPVATNNKMAHDKSIKLLPGMSVEIEVKVNK